MSKEQSKAVFQELQKQYKVSYSIGDLTPTICTLFGVPEPDECGGTPIPAVADQADKLLKGFGKTQRGVLFCADALGEWQRQHFTEDFKKIEKVAGFRIQSASVMPSVTPVCYGTIFSGAAPCVHGIQKYEKPVLKVQTLFDVFAAAGKNVAICSVNDCSIDRIFRGRNVDYYSFRTDEQSFAQTLDLMERSNYDLIVCYMTGYDDFLHATGPFSPECTEQAHLAAERFCILAEKMDQYWKQYNRVLTFVPDHGGHAVTETTGGHGTDMAEDMIVNHYYRLCAAGK